MSIRELLKENRDQILSIAKRHGASNVRIFGSVARKQETVTSDLDILVDFEKGRSLMDHAALIIDLQDLLSCKVDVATEYGLKERIRAKVMNDLVSL
ncbi:MAG: nucleotidyltransferase family protein [Armatimonadota bacterium]